MKSIVAPILTLALLASLSAGAAQAAGIDSDVRCLAIADRVAQSPDAKAKESGRMGQIFFLGRVNGGAGGSPTASVLAASMVQAAHSLTGDYAKTEANRCSAIMKGAFTLLETAGPIANKSLQARAPAAPAR